jgi:hypothetical protein
MNGFKHPLTGLTAVMTDEDRGAQLSFVRAYIDDLGPRGPVELQLARILALDNWRLNRIKMVEENIFAWGYEVDPGRRVTSPIAEVENAFSHANSFLTHSRAIDKISLYESRLSRTIARNLELLMKLQARRPERARNRTSSPATEPHTMTAAASASAASPAADSSESQPMPQAA